MKRYAKDDYDVQGTVIRRLPTGGGANIFVTLQSYNVEKRQRMKQGIEIPKWRDLEIYFKEGKYEGDT